MPVCEVEPKVIEAPPETINPVSAILEKAADLVATGWTQRTMVHRVMGVGHYCLMGAIHLASGGWFEPCRCSGECGLYTSYGGDNSLSKLAYIAVEKLVGDNPMRWNDYSKRTQQDVITALRCAARIEHE